MSAALGSWKSPVLYSFFDESSQRLWMRSPEKGEWTETHSLLARPSVPLAPCVPSNDFPESDEPFSLQTNSEWTEKPSFASFSTPTLCFFLGKKHVQKSLEFHETFSTLLPERVETPSLETAALLPGEKPLFWSFLWAGTQLLEKVPRFHGVVEPERAVYWLVWLSSPFLTEPQS